MKTESEINKRLKELENDERLYYPSANVFVNAPLALIQTELEAQVDTLRWVLGLPSFHRARQIASDKKS